MPNSITSEIEYFFHEGKENLEECLRISFETALRRQVRTIVIFTGVGEGPKLALDKFSSQDCYSHIRLIAVTFPYGRFTNAEQPIEDMEISREDREYLKGKGVTIIRAHMPFNPIAAHQRDHGLLGQDLTLIGNALTMFCGSMSLCVQAALMACDAGELELGEHVISLTSDTSILVRTAPTQRLLTDFIVREIICKPMSLTIAKRENRLADQPPQLTLELPDDDLQLDRPAKDFDDGVIDVL